MIDAGSYNNLGQLLHDAMVMHKSRTALVELSRKREASRWSYLDMRCATQALQHWFSDAGVTPGMQVAIIMSNQPRWLLAAAALLARGAVLVPLDYKLTPAEHDALLAHSGAGLVVAEYAFWRKLGSDLPALVSEAPPRVDLPDHATRFATALEAPRLHDAPWSSQRDDIASIVYSSGTGGAPKGCMMSHGAYLSQLDALLRLYPMEPDDSWFSILPTNHAIDFMCGFLGPLACGARVVHQRALRPEFLLWSMKRFVTGTPPINTLGQRSDQ